MRKIHISVLQPGMRVGRALYNSSGQLLLSAGTILTRKTIARLEMAAIPAVYVDDGFLKDPAIVDVVSEEIRVQAVRQVRELLAEAAVPGTGTAVVAISEIKETVSEIIDQLLKNPDVVFNLIDIRAIDDYTFGHSVSVSVLSLLTGITLGYSREELLALGMGALLHDVGKTVIPDSILNKAGKLSPEEFALVREHPERGFRMLLQIPGVSASSALIALQHHERYQGQGYPRGLRGDEIHEFAVICGVADVFDALVADRVYRRAYPVHEAYELIAGSGNFLFDYRIVQAFLQNVAAYPVGTLVRLSTGETGVVIEARRGMALYPKVRILFDREGSACEPYEMDLWKEREVLISGVVEGDLGTRRTAEKQPLDS
ncbi:MAG TPA: HD-GYP domain-containing protein [Desulfotomaculum sp.]|nr:HD-GYP domain-containing protein [Desulfotomaculum sp.]